jgi:hypothetical protein
MESKLAVQDIYARNNHNNLFQLKVPSPNASQHSLRHMAHAFILSKLALIPFHEDAKTTQLYRTSLEELLALPKEYFKSPHFVEQLTDYLTLWEQNMR